MMKNVEELGKNNCYGLGFGDLAIGEMGELNVVIFFCLLVTATLSIYSAIKDSPRFWHFFAALAITSFLLILGYWLRSALFEANIQDYQMMTGQASLIPGRAYLNHLNFILQSMIGVFMMIVALTIRRFGRDRK